MQIEHSVSVVTGGASGMGAATATLLASLGAKVAILDLNEKAAQDLSTEIKAYPYKCDVTNADEVDQILKDVVKTLGPIRIGINCAGIVHSRRMVNKQGPMPLDEFNRVIQINLIGTFNLMRLLATAMIPNDLVGEERGIIINTASVAAFDGQIGQTAYTASKAAIAGITLPAARELAQFAIRVMTIAPGLVDTPMFKQLTPEAIESLSKSVPFPKRLAKPYEYAKLCQHIIENPMLNGEVIRLDGALRMAPQ